MEQRDETIKAKDEEAKRVDREAAKYASRGISLSSNNEVGWHLGDLLSAFVINSSLNVMILKMLNSNFSLE